MIEERRLMIFGLHRSDDAAVVRALIGQHTETAAPIEVLPIPGDNDDAFALVRLAPDPLAAWRLAGRIDSRRLHGRPLKAWISAMPWG